MISQKNQPQPDSLLANLRNTLNKIIDNQQINEERKRQGDLAATIAQKKQEESLFAEIKNLRAQLLRKTSELEQVKRLLNEQEHEINSNYKREFRHLSDSLVEKQAEIQYLGKHVFTLKNRVTSLEQDLSQSNSSRKSLEQSLTKTVELIKSQFKQLFDNKQDKELNRFMSQTNLKQINDKLEALLNICVDIEKKKSFMEDKYCMLKKQNTQQIQNNIKLQVELEKIKEQLWQEKQIVQSYSRNKQFSFEQVQFLSKKSKSSRLNPGPSQMNSQEDKNHSQKLQLPYQQNTEQMISLLKAQTSMLLNMEQKLISLNKKINHDTDIWRQVLTVKQVNADLQLELNQLKAQVNPQHQDLLLKEKHTHLYNFFIEKMSQIQKFQKRLESLQNEAHRIVSTLDHILYNGAPENQLKPDDNEILEKENAVRSKVKKEMLQVFDLQKQNILKDAQMHHQTEIQALKNKIADLNHEVSRLQDKNQNLFNLLEESQKVNKRKDSIEEKSEKIQICQIEIDHGQPKFETQSITGLNPSQISHLNFLEEKVQRLEEQLKECHKRIETYKKEIHHMLEAYKLKNTKNKFSRCSECLLRIDDSEDYNKKCPKCKLDIHGGDCAKMHEKNCKKNTLNLTNTTTNKPKPKKPEVKTSAFSQRVDYF